ncbi:hypothetical protein R1flu_025274 [Riccia fluitans]|uniref:DUF4210 domain-containing protein n=1 Tax=Riccia fluitans TaxID=41844 RepID=A0ABD1XXA1_9MARC
MAKADEWLEQPIGSYQRSFSTPGEASDNSGDESYRSAGSSLPCSDHTACFLSAGHCRKRSNSWGSESSVPSLLEPVYQRTVEHLDLATPWLQTSLYPQRLNELQIPSSAYNKKLFLVSSSEPAQSSLPRSHECYDHEASLSSKENGTQMLSKPCFSSSNPQGKKYRSGTAPVCRGGTSVIQSTESPLVQIRNVHEAETWLSRLQKGHEKTSQRLPVHLSTPEELSYLTAEATSAQPSCAIDDSRERIYGENSVLQPESRSSIQTPDELNSIQSLCTTIPPASPGQVSTFCRTWPGDQRETLMSYTAAIDSELSVSSTLDHKAVSLIHPLPGDVIITFSPLLSNAERDATFVYFQKETEPRTSRESSRRAMLLRFGEFDRDGTWVASIQVRLFYKAANDDWRLLAKTFITKLPWLHRSKRSYMRLKMPDPHFKPRSGDLILRTVNMVSESASRDLERVHQKETGDLSWSLVSCDRDYMPLTGDMIVRAYVGPAPKRNNQNSRLLLGRVELYTRQDVYYLYMGRDQHTFPLKLRSKSKSSKQRLFSAQHQ